MGARAKRHRRDRQAAGPVVVAVALVLAAAGPMGSAQAQSVPAPVPVPTVLSDATIVATNMEVGAGVTGGTLATCPAGRRVVGGGVGTIGAGAGGVQVSGPVDETGETANTNAGDVARSWRASVRNGSGALRAYKVFALCSATSDATIAAAPFSQEMGITQRSAAATCPTGRRVVGGGLGQVSGGSGGGVELSGPLDETGLTANTTTGDVARGWFASYSNTGSPKTNRVLALCSANSDATVAEVTFALGEGVSGREAAVMCPAGRRALGGGIGTTAATVNSSVQASGPLDASGTTADTSTGDVARSWLAEVTNNPEQLITPVGPRTYKTFALCGSDGSATAPNTPGGGSGAGGPGAGGAGAGGVRSAAKLQVARAAVDRSRRRLDVFAPISRLASGEVQVTLLAGGRTTRFSAPIDPRAGRVRVSRQISLAQARAGTGIVTLSYGGDADTQPQVVRLRAASGAARLMATRPVIRDGRLVSGGEISRRARGVVRLQLVYTTQTGVTRSLEYSAAIRRGAYRLAQPLPRGVLDEIARRRGVVHSYVLFTGYGGARMRGEMRSYEVLGDPAGPS